jgi:hypothetical protein
LLAGKELEKSAAKSEKTETFPAKLGFQSYAPENNRVSRENKHPPVANPSTPQASNRWVNFN